MDRLRLLPAVLLLALAFSPPAAAKEGGSEIVTTPSSGHLTVTGGRVSVLGSLELDPCVERLAVAVTPLVKVAGIGKLKGTLRSGGTVPAGAVVSKHYLVEGKMTVRDGVRTVAENMNVFVAATAPKPGAESTVKEMEGRISLDWDGLNWSKDGLSVLPQGNYTADVEILLLRVVVDKYSTLLREEILDRGVVRVAIQLGPKIDECRAWARIAPGLGKGPDRKTEGGPRVEMVAAPLPPPPALVAEVVVGGPYSDPVESGAQGPLAKLVQGEWTSYKVLENTYLEIRQSFRVRLQ